MKVLIVKHIFCRFYEGVITSFNHSKMKHQVVYVDGDEELLDLKNERWELMGDVILPGQGQDTVPGPNVSADVFSDGVVDSSGPARKKHVVLDNGGTETILSTSKESQKLVRSKPRRNRGKSTDTGNLDASSKTHEQHPPTVTQMDTHNMSNPQSSQNEEGEKCLMEISSTLGTPMSTGQDAVALNGMIDVQGYSVKPSNAPVLRAIFAKYGDIATNCLYKSSSVRASLLDVVCSVVQRLLTNDNTVLMSYIEAIESEVSDAEKAKLKVSWLRKHLTKVHEIEAVGHRSSLLKEAKTRSSLAIKMATKDLEQKRVDLVEAQEQFRQAERCVEALKLVSQKINNDVLESVTEENLLRRKLDELL
ncbi:unnamed protein product [Ilex paraguariensis]|uniref:Phospholipase-like protein n=1 Tax=Ilex paraguariensis TaxID=185542 RepID=A0ABC8SR87_9AQUA